ncbi:subtilase family protein [Mobilisporobacter senegalensis]|uniref:Subtilase family protein n=1 Tax=Mobilisporobacter senegalensis TaxID=1329262 RepID=A0A3N1XRE0_9FIRM|nr:S8 family peptidase [Mobilisporobacter senegalensis]ROR27367.1 subtilase family protein [Mobilisporobacter senegalensis]
MNEEEKRKITSNDFIDLLIEYSGDQRLLAEYGNETINVIDDRFAVVYLPAERTSERLLTEVGYSVIPKLYGLLDTAHLEAVGINRLQATPTLNLRGQGVLLGFIDTGIEYTNPIFKHADNTTRIVSIWDQTIENLQAGEDLFYYGTEYTKDMINEALQNDNPLSVVPSTDTNGHGTMLAGLAGGSQIPESDFTGIASQAEFVVVKLKPAKQNLKDYLLVPNDTLCYQGNDFMFGIRYLVNVARRLGKPIAICVGLGTNQGAHDGNISTSIFLSDLANRAGIAILVAAGNEGNTGHHYFGVVDRVTGYDTVELRVGENEKNFTMEIWGQVPGTYSIDVTSPSGEHIPRIPARLGEHRDIRFLFEGTRLLIDYLIIESQTGDQLIFLRFNQPAPGIWRFRVYGGGDISSGFHIWLPMRGFITEETTFMNPNPDTVITTPGNGNNVITVTAYNHKDQSIYQNASRGYSRANQVKPDVAAPGVEVYVPLPGNQFGYQSGTSIAAALATGVSGLLLEWGIVNDRQGNMDGVNIRKFLYRGVNQKSNLVYPNNEWGYGSIDIYKTFESFRGEQ